MYPERTAVKYLAMFTSASTHTQFLLAFKAFSSLSLVIIQREREGWRGE